MRNFLLTLGLLFAIGCPKKNDTPPPPPPAPPPPAGGDRVPAVAKDDKHYERVEGTGFKNDCAADDACKTGGCSSEVCSAEEGVNTTCEMPAEGWPKGEGCGCVSGQCVWYNSGGSAGAPKQGEPCPDGKCGAGLTCMQYYGVAGPSGPQFSSCEIPCPDDNTACPAGQGCTTIADGPGRVCRPAK